MVTLHRAGCERTTRRAPRSSCRARTRRQHRPPVGDRPAAQPRPDRGEQDQGTGDQPEEHHPHRGNLAEQAFGDHRPSCTKRGPPLTIRRRSPNSRVAPDASSFRATRWIRRDVTSGTLPQRPLESGPRYLHEHGRVHLGCRGCTAEALAALRPFQGRGYRADCRHPNPGDRPLGSKDGEHSTAGWLQ